MGRVVRQRAHRLLSAVGLVLNAPESCACHLPRSAPVLLRKNRANRLVKPAVKKRMQVNGLGRMGLATAVTTLRTAPDISEVLRNIGGHRL